jgi:hypothetical protein
MSIRAAPPDLSGPALPRRQSAIRLSGRRPSGITTMTSKGTPQGRFQRACGEPVPSARSAGAQRHAGALDRGGEVQILPASRK